MWRRLIGLLLGLSAAKLWLAGTVPWFVGLALLAGAALLLIGARSPSDRGHAHDEGRNDP
jgi:hypothetical protein